MSEAPTDVRPATGVKISAVSTLVVEAGLRNWIFVKVETDEPGLVGWGEASLEWKTRAVVGAIQDLTPLLVGEDPNRLEHLWQTLYRAHFFKGGVVSMSAISGIDQALHDIKAKALGVPLYELLGGRVRDRVRMYDHLGGGDSKAVYESATVAAFADAARRSVEAGFTALKILPVPAGPMLDGIASIRHAESLMAAVRDAAGDGVEIMVDLHGRTTPAMAIQYGHALRAYRPWFLEEPCQPEQVEGIAEVARALPIPIATGERLVGRVEFDRLLRQRACAVIQPDVCHCGGVSEIKKISAMAETALVAVAPHNPLGPIATAVNVHVAFSTPNFLIQEVMRSDVPWRDEIVTLPFEISHGEVAPPSGVGIGVEIDEDAARAHPYRQEPRIECSDAYGALADW